MANKTNRRTWIWNEDMIPEVQYLKEKNALKINPYEYEKCYELDVGKKHKTYSQGYMILFHNTVMDEAGEKVISTSFVFIPLKKITWVGEMGYTPEIEYLCKNFNFIDDPDGDEKMYTMKLKDDSWVVFPRETKIKFSNIRKNDEGKVESLNFVVQVDKEKIWYGEDGDCPEMEFLRKKYSLITDPDNFESMYRFKVKGKWFEFPNGARCVIRRRVYDEEGNIISMLFKWQKLQWV